MKHVEGNQRPPGTSGVAEHDHNKEWITKITSICANVSEDHACEL